MFHWLHHLINPHCAQCEKEKEEQRLDAIEREAEKGRCRSCEIQEKELAIANKRIDDLLERLVSKNENKNEINDVEDFVPIKPKYIPWNVKRQQLQQQLRTAHQMRTGQSIDDLEKELDISHATTGTQNS